MKNRNPLTVFLLTILTGGIYGWYWFIKTKDEMNQLGEKIPTAWIWLIPLIGNFWWLWKYAQGVEHVSKNELNMFLTLLALYLLGPIGMAIVQEAFNRTGVPVVAQEPVPPHNPANSKPDNNNDYPTPNNNLTTIFSCLFF